MNTKQLVLLLLGVLITVPTSTALHGQERPELQRLERELRQQLERNRGNDQQRDSVRERERLQAARVKLEAQLNALRNESVKKQVQSDDRAPQRASAERVQRERAVARERLEHMKRAHEHLMAAGMTEIAQQVAERANGLQKRLELAARETDQPERPARRRAMTEGDSQAEIIGAIRELNAAVRQLRGDLAELREDVEEIEEDVEEIEEAVEDDDDEGDDDDDDGDDDGNDDGNDDGDDDGDDDGHDEDQDGDDGDDDDGDGDRP